MFMGFPVCESIKVPSSRNFEVSSMPNTVVLGETLEMIVSLKKLFSKVLARSYYRGVLICVSVGPRLILYWTR